MLNFNIEARITIRFRSDHQKRYRLEFKPFTFDSAKILQNYASERLFNVQRTHPRFIAIHRGKRTVKMLCTTIDDDKIYNLTVAVMQPHKHTSQECKIDCFYSLWHVSFSTDPNYEISIDVQKIGKLDKNSQSQVPRVEALESALIQYHTAAKRPQLSGTWRHYNVGVQMEIFI